VEKSVQLGSVRFRLQSMLLGLSNYDFQLEWYGDPDRQKQPTHIGISVTLEDLIEDFGWGLEDAETESPMIGTILRSQAEVNACRAVYILSLELHSQKDRNSVSEDYINDPAWPQIIAAARHALRIMLQGDS
jgi:hypothetical protein